MKLTSLSEFKNNITKYKEKITMNKVYYIYVKGAGITTRLFDRKETATDVFFTLLNDINTSDAFLLYFDIMFFDSNGKRSYIDPLFESDFTVEIFKEFEQFDYEIEPLPQEPGKYGCWIMHIFNIHTREEVARYG